MSHHQEKPVNPAYDVFYKQQHIPHRLEYTRKLLKEHQGRKYNVKRYRERKSEQLVTTKAYKRAMEGLEMERILDEESITRKVGKRVGDIRMPKKIATVVGAGVALGTIHTLTDDVDDNLLSTGLKVGGYTAAIGGTYAVIRRYNKQDVEQRRKREDHWKDVRDRYERQTSTMEKNYWKEHEKLVKQGYSDDKATYELKKRGVPNTNSRERAFKKLGGIEVTKEMVKEERAVRTAKGVMRAGKIGVGITALGGLVSAAHSVKQSHDAKQMVEKQTEQQERNKQRKKQEMARYGYGNVDMGNIVLEMFEERTGHHRMGDSKF